MTEKGHAIILFDGVCNFCNARINFIIRHDKKDYFRFAALQSDSGKKILADHNILLPDPDTFILIEHNKIYNRTSAALRIAKQLNGLWPVFFAFIIVPPFIRDIVYRVIAKNRYRWWGKRESCMIPTPEVRAKFL
ncbi:MAG TPA: DCC1-like thiol-disulfide oxidoreductase family protein [Bacteroidia bacterium]|nr:DCC1-like thiol-disulfide oxidoreductase family protein [Bacteroidia bacterium]